MENLEKVMNRIEQNFKVLEDKTFTGCPYHMEVYHTTKGMIMTLLTLELISREEYNKLYERLEPNNEFFNEIAAKHRESN